VVLQVQKDNEPCAPHVALPCGAHKPEQHKEDPSSSGKYKTKGEEEEEEHKSKKEEHKAKREEIKAKREEHKAKKEEKEDKEEHEGKEDHKAKKVCVLGGEGGTLARKDKRRGYKGHARSYAASKPSKGKQHP
jgi:hypothetical protein